MATYIALFFVPVVLKLLCDAFSITTKKTYCIVCCIVLTVFAGMRGLNVGTDTKSYIYEYIAFTNIGAYASSNEIGLKYLWTLLVYLHLGPNVFLLIASLCINAGVFYIIYKHSNNASLSSVLYIGLYYYLFSFNGLRQFMGIGILLFAFEMAYNNKFVKCAILICIAILFHRLSVLGVPFLFLCGKNKHIKIKVSLAVIFVVICALNFNTLLQYVLNNNAYYGEYYRNYSYRAGGIMSAIIYLIIFIIVTVLNLLYKRYDRETLIFWIISFICVIGGVIQVNAFVAMRLFYLFDMFSVIAIPNSFMRCVDETKPENNIGKFRYSVPKSEAVKFLITTSVVFVYYYYCLSFNWHQVIPYTIGIFN